MIATLSSRLTIDVLNFHSKWHSHPVYFLFSLYNLAFRLPPGQLFRFFVKLIPKRLPTPLREVLTTSDLGREERHPRAATMGNSHSNTY